MLDWLKNGEDGHLDTSMRTPASAAKLLAGMRQADPAAALEELTGWLDKGLLPHDAKARSEVLAQIHESGGAHVSALLAQFVGKPSGGGSQQHAGAARRRGGRRGEVPRCMPHAGEGLPHALPQRACQALAHGVRGP